MPAFSIIVPVYNAEKTLHKCLDSLYKQTDPDFEVLMIENGSVDTSNAICRQYANKDPRFLLHACEENHGPSGARNIGLEHSIGHWVTFVDSDDFVVPDYLESLRLSFMQRDADVVFFGYCQTSLDGTSFGEYVPQIPENTNFYETLLQLAQQDLFGYTWIKAFRRDVIGQHRFSRELNLLEDEVFACEILSDQRRLAILSKPIYNYITGNTGSLMGRTHQDYCQKVDNAYRAWKILLKDYPEKKDVLTAQANAHVNRCMYYGFEREVNPNDFFHSLVQSAFFRDSTLENPFCTHARSGHWEKLRWMRTLYRIKISAAKLLKK